MDTQLTQLLNNQQVWQGKHWSNYQVSSESSCYPDVDKNLPGHGWPKGALTELLCDQQGIGELSLLIPALAKLSQQKRWILWVAPPFMLNAPALQDAGVDTSRILVVHAEQVKDVLWALEKGLKSGGCSAVLGWVENMAPNTARRLQLAAEQSQSLAFLFRPQSQQQQTSPSAIRALVSSGETDKVEVELFKRRGAWPMTAFQAELGRRDIYRPELIQGLRPH